MKFATTLICIGVLAANCAVGQSIHFDDQSKASPAVLEKARQGISQDLFVILDANSVLAREDQKRQAKGLKFNDSQINEEADKELDDLKGTVFPGGRLDDAVVIKSHRYVPLLFVKVPNLKALARILADPRVEAVQENKTYAPALSESFAKPFTPYSVMLATDAKTLVGLD